MLTTLLPALALAAEPTAELRALAATGREDLPAERLVGLGLSAGLALPVVQPELALEAARGTAPALDARLELRAGLPPGEGLRLSALAGAGLRLQEGPQPRLALGLSVERPGEGPLSLRVSGRYLFDGIEPSAIQLAAGVAWGPRGAAPAPVVDVPPDHAPPAAEPAPPASGPLAGAQRALPEVLRVAPEGSVIWIPHPWCEWLPVDEAQPRLAELPEGTALRVLAPDGSSRVVVLGPERPVDIALPSRAPGGALVVAAWPDDAVRVGELGLALAEDGVAILRADPGLIDLDLVGGGREQRLTLDLDDGVVIWVRPEPPPPTRVRFAAGQAELTPEAAAALTALVEARGTWGLRVQGSFSPEGDPEANQALARARAEAVADFLRASGLPEDALRVEEGLATPDPGLSTADQRACLVTPLRPEGSP